MPVAAERKRAPSSFTSLPFRLRSLLRLSSSFFRRPSSIPHRSLRRQRPPEAHLSIEKIANAKKSKHKNSSLFSSSAARPPPSPSPSPLPRSAASPNGPPPAPSSTRSFSSSCRASPLASVPRGRRAPGCASCRRATSRSATLPRSTRGARSARGSPRWSGPRGSPRSRSPRS